MFKKIITLSDPNVVSFFKDNMMELINKKFDIIFCNRIYMGMGS